MLTSMVLSQRLKAMMKFSNSLGTLNWIIFLQSLKRRFEGQISTHDKIVSKFVY